jgi:hypothetical protein
MRIIEHITDIDAPAASVWGVLTDVAAYPDWNPFMSMEMAPDRVGQRLSVTLRAGKRTMTMKPTVTALEPGGSICWLGRLFVPWIFDGAHELHVEPLEDGRSRFIHRETFRGVLVPFVRGVLRDTDAGFAAMNAALRTRAETLAARRGGRS